MSQQAEDRGLRIGELSRLTGVSVRLLRYYESQGLLHPQRTSSGYRQYASTAPSTVDRIRQLLRAGLSTRTIAEVLPCIRDDGTAMTPTCPVVRATIARERDRVAAAMVELRRSRDLLSDIVAAG